MFQARYPGKCVRCGEQFTPGTMVEIAAPWGGSKTNYRHSNMCVTGRDNLPSEMAYAETLVDDYHEREYDAMAAAEFAARPRLDLPGRRICPNYNASYCPAHDYDHVLERGEQQADFNYHWATMKNEAAAQEREQEAAIYLNGAV